MNLKINYHNIYIIIFTSFFFLWGVSLYFPFLESNYLRDNLSNFRLSYLIVLLIIPIFYSCLKKNFSSFNQIFNFQKYIIIFILFIVAHFFIIKIYYSEIVSKSEIMNLSYLILLSVIYCHYRDFISDNFKKILTLYLIIFVLFSIFEGMLIQSKIYNYGQCNNDLFLINLIKSYLKISLTNSIYLENSHLAMMTVAVFFSSLYILVKEKKNDILFLLLFSIEVIIVLNNLSTTYFVAYFFSHITLLLFFFKKLSIKYWIIIFLFLFMNSYLFFSDKHCVVKITDFSLQDVSEDILDRGMSRGESNPNLTTGIYMRSIIVAKKTLLNHSLGWGIDGMDNANKSLLNNYKQCDTDTINITSKNINQSKKIGMINRCNHRVPYNIKGYNEKFGTFYPLKELNLKDGLSNSLKLFTEFGIFAFIFYFYFLKYLLNIKNINSYNIFIIVLFITLSIRGAGYFNGGFIFCLLEFFYYKKFSHNEYKK